MTKKIRLKVVKPIEGMNIISIGITQLRKHANDFVKESDWTLTAPSKNLDMELKSFNDKEAIIKFKGKKSTVNEFLLTLTTKQAFAQIFCWEEL